MDKARCYEMFEHFHCDEVGLRKKQILETGWNIGALKLRRNAVLVCVCDIECNWVNSNSNVRSVLLQAYATRPTCLTSK